MPDGCSRWCVQSDVECIEIGCSMCVVVWVQAIAYVCFELHLYIPSEFCTYHCVSLCCSISLCFCPSRSLAGDGEQEGVSSRVPLPPPLMSSTTGTGEREGEGDGSVDGDGRLVPQLMVDKDGKIVVNENRCVCVGEGPSMLD